MYDNFKIANYNNSLVSPEFYAKPLSRLFGGDVIDGLTVVPGTGLQVTLQPGNAFLRYGSAAVASARIVSLIADFNLAIAAPDASNPRIDVVVLYVDNGVSLPTVDATHPPTSANLDGPGVAKAKIVSGTPNASPVAPTAGAIQASVVAGNPYTVLYQVRVDPGVALIAANKITDVRATAKIGSDKIDFATFTPSTVTDANGWVVTNYGTHKVATKLTTGSESKVRFEIATRSSVNLPVGVSTAAGIKTIAAAVEAGSFSDFVALTRNNTASPSSTSLAWVYMYLGPTSATSYTVPIRFTVTF